MDKNNHYSLAIIGLGYVGLPLAIEFSKKYPTIGFDKSNKRVNELNEGRDKTREVSEDQLNQTNIKFTTEASEIKNCNVYIVTVPTPVDNYNNPNMKPLASSSKTVGEVLKKGDIVIYESTVYPGATEEFCVPILEEVSGFEFNKDFFCGYSPERINPGDKNHRLTTITKVTSGSTEKIGLFVDSLYSSIIPAGTHKAPSIAVAEASKVIENIQRDVNIALINELSMIFNKLDLDTYEVLEAAGTKWNFLPFRPGLVGGHCIGVDPYYLTHKAQEIGYYPDIILAGRKINEKMGDFIAHSMILEMAKIGINPIQSRVAVFGLTFKENTKDLRNTKVMSIIDNLKGYNCEVVVTDPFADRDEASTLFEIDLVDDCELKNIDGIIVAVAHDDYKSKEVEDWLAIFGDKGVFIDVKSICEKKSFEGTGILHWRL